MSEFYGILTTIGQVKMAASIGGAALNLTTIRVGDGGGAPITPAPGMTDLVRRVGAAYPILTSAADGINAAYWRVGTLIPADDGPFDIREIGVFDAEGDMIAIARHPLVEKRGAGQGVAIEVDTDVVFPVLAASQIAVTISANGYATILYVQTALEDYVRHDEVPDILRGDRIALTRHWRLPFMAVNSLALNAPPADPVAGDTYVVAADAAGAWAGKERQLAQWTGAAPAGQAWVFAAAPARTIVGDAATGRYFERTATGWEELAMPTRKAMRRRLFFFGQQG